MKLLGIKINHYISNMESYTKYILCFISINGDKKQIIYDTKINNDISFYIKNVESFNGLSLIPTELISIPFFDNNYDNIDDFIKIILLKLHSFKKTIRYKDKRPIWLFGGSSKNAKRFISSKTNISKFDLYEHNFLPDLIECDIIILNDNKYDINSVNNIKKKCIGNNEFIYVNFEEIYYSNSPLYIFRKKQYVYIFIGDTNLGKSYIAHSLQNLTVYETDENNSLPDFLDHNIVIINKSTQIDIEDIMSRYNGKNTFFLVEFSNC